MKTISNVAILLLISGIIGCNQPAADSGQTDQTVVESNNSDLGGQASVKDTESDPNVVGIAVNSKDHTTLVAAIKAAGLVDALANNGPFTVFAPTNEAFDKLPAGTLDDLLKPENVGALKNVLYYHVAPGIYKKEMLKDGQQLGMANDGKVMVSIQDGQYKVNGSNIVASVPASNGIVHVIDGVLLQGN